MPTFPLPPVDPADQDPLDQDPSDQEYSGQDATTTVRVTAAEEDNGLPLVPYHRQPADGVQMLLKNDWGTIDPNVIVSIGGGLVKQLGWSVREHVQVFRQGDALVLVRCDRRAAAGQPLLAPDLTEIGPRPLRLTLPVSPQLKAQLKAHFDSLGLDFHYGRPDDWFDIHSTVSDGRLVLSFGTKAAKVDKSTFGDIEEEFSAPSEDYDVTEKAKTSWLKSAAQFGGGVLLVGLALAFGGAAIGVSMTVTAHYLNH